MLNTDPTNPTNPHAPSTFGPAYPQSDLDSIRPSQYRLVLELARPRILSYSLAQAPTEAVGLISHRGTMLPLINQRRSNREFLVSRTFLEEGVAWMTERGETPVAIYHSHPTETSDPSRTDLDSMKENPGSVHIIHSLNTRLITAWIWENDQLIHITEVSDV